MLNFLREIIKDSKDGESRSKKRETSSKKDGPPSLKVVDIGIFLSTHNRPIL